MIAFLHRWLPHASIAQLDSQEHANASDHYHRAQQESFENCHHLLRLLAYAAESYAGAVADLLVELQPDPSLTPLDRGCFPAVPVLSVMQK